MKHFYRETVKMIATQYDTILSLLHVKSLKEFMIKSFWAQTSPHSRSIEELNTGRDLLLIL
jgi:hypothetical protein